MSETWSSKIQGVDTLNLNREVRFTDKTFKMILDVIDVQETDKVLELGCGPGTFTRRLASFYPEMSITGLDFDKKFIKFCKEQANVLNYVNIEYHQGNALETKFNDNYFDVCISHTVIEHLPNEEFLKEQFRILKPGGRVVVLNTRADFSLRSEESIEPSRREEELLEKVDSTLHKLNEQNQVAQYTANPQQILKTMESVGFSEIQIDAIPYTVCLDDNRNSINYKVQILESKRRSLMEYVQMSMAENPDTLSELELRELEALISQRYSERVLMIENGENVWEFNVTPTITMIGRKPATHK